MTNGLNKQEEALAKGNLVTVAKKLSAGEVPLVDGVRRILSFQPHVTRDEHDPDSCFL
jgi:hypothetical protein